MQWKLPFKTFNILLLEVFLPTFFSSVFFFSSLLDVAELYAKFGQYLINKSKIIDILYVQALYLPFCIWQTVPLSILFSSVFTIGNLYVNNELVAVLSSGTSFRKFVSPVILFAILLCFFQFFFNEIVVVKTLNMKKQIEDKMTSSYSEDNYIYNESEIHVSDMNFTVFYKIGSYEESKKTFYNATIIEVNKDFVLTKRIDAASGYWDDKKNLWILEKASIFEVDKDKKVKAYYREHYEDIKLKVDYRAFLGKNGNYSSFTLKELKDAISVARSARLSYGKEATEYHKRFAFSLTSLISALIALSVGSRLKKNILLLSLLSSVIIAVLYYIVQMLSTLYSENDIIPPIIGAWGGEIFSLIIAVFLLFNARS